MPYVMVDVEADGPVPGDYSMICFGAVIVEPQLNRTYYGRLKPISDKFVPEALQVSGFSRKETLAFGYPRPRPFPSRRSSRVRVQPLLSPRSTGRCRSLRRGSTSGQRHREGH